MPKKEFKSVTDSVFSNFFTQPEELNNVEEENKLVQTVEQIDNSDFILKEEKKIKKEKPIKKEKVQPVQEIKKEELSSSTEKNIRSLNTRTSRFNLHLDPYISDYINNVTWIKRKKSATQYINELIQSDLISTLNISQNSSVEEIEIAWQKYKKDNNL